MIEDYGWSAELQDTFAPHAALGLIPARVTAHHRGSWRLMTPRGERTGRLSGRFMLEAAQGEHPVVGDWLAVSEVEGSGGGPAGAPGGAPGGAMIHALLPRRGAFKRRAAGDGGVQVVAANIDTALLVAALNGDLNLRRLERYLVAARDGGARPVIVLTKADLSADPQGAVREVEAIAGGAAVAALSALTGEGLEGLSAWLKPGATAVLLGSSGAGKSTLLNALAGDTLMDTGAVRASDDRGRHTTTHRELFRLPGGALLVDTPGMRELGLLAVEEALDASFEDVIALFPQCRFSDCTHEREPGCAVLAGLADGTLGEERWRGYQKLQRELAFEATKDDPAAEAARRSKWKQIHRDQRSKLRQRNRDRE